MPLLDRTPVRALALNSSRIRKGAGDMVLELLGPDSTSLGFPAAWDFERGAGTVTVSVPEDDAMTAAVLDEVTYFALDDAVHDVGNAPDQVSRPESPILRVWDFKGTFSRRRAA